jgi:hypothetical protein
MLMHHLVGGGVGQPRTINMSLLMEVLSRPALSIGTPTKHSLYAKADCHNSINLQGLDRTHRKELPSQLER